MPVAALTHDRCQDFFRENLFSFGDLEWEDQTAEIVSSGEGREMILNAMRQAYFIHLKSLEVSKPPTFREDAVSLYQPWEAPSK